MVADQTDKKKALLAPLDEAAYEAVSVPTSDEIRAARQRGAAELRHAAEQPKPAKVDPKIRFR